MKPRFGNMLGGTAVLISGTRFEMGEKISCNFGGHEVEGSLIDESSALCVSPQLSKLGFITFGIAISNRRMLESQFLSREYTL